MKKKGWYFYRSIFIRKAELIWQRPPVEDVNNDLVVLVEILK